MLVLVTLVLVLAMAGCGTEPADVEADDAVPQNDVEATPEDPAPENGVDDAPVEFKYWENPQGMAQLLGMFKELKFELSSRDHVGGVSYRYEGSDSVGGVEASKVIVETTTNGQVDMSVAIWVDEAGNTLQVAMDGEVLPGEMAEMFTGPLLGFVFMPFHITSGYEPDKVLTGIHPYVTVESISTGTRTFGALSGKVYETVISVTEGGKTYRAEWHIGDFGDLQMMTMYKALDVTNGDFAKYELVSVELR